ncbi:MAG: glycosyltransferase family 4 protein [Bdellovibrionaceae bacterium]|nr:glycosyltransferase family 4 protein [Pseudobdellovibrionaceae bacterium]
MKTFLQVCLSRSWGGLEMVAGETARSMKSKGHASFVVCPQGSPLADYCAKQGIPMLHMELKKRPAPFLSMKLRRFIEDQGVTDVVIHQLKDLWIVTPALWKLSGVRAIGFSHTFLDYKKKDFFHRVLYRRLNILIALTQRHLENLLIHLPVEKSQMQIIPNSVDAEQFHPSKKTPGVREQFHVRDSEVLIGVIGRLDPQKGQIETVEAAHLLKQRGLGFKLIFVGEETKNSPGLGAKLKARIQELGLQDEVFMTGFLENPDRVTASLDIFVMPSYAETFGKVLLEAMSSEVAVVATDAGGVPDILAQNHEGLLVTPKDPIVLADALETLIRQAEKRAEFARNARKRILKDFSTDVVNRQLDQLFGV